MPSSNCCSAWRISPSTGSTRALCRPQVGHEILQALHSGLSRCQTIRVKFWALTIVGREQAVADALGLWPYCSKSRSVWKLPSDFDIF